MYAFDESTAIGFVEVTADTTFSFAEPPRYVAYRKTFPARLSFAAKASKPPPFEICKGDTVGRFVDDVNPVTYTPAALTAIPVPRSSPLPPR